MQKATLLLALVFMIFSYIPVDQEKSSLRFVIDSHTTEQELADLIASANAINIQLEVNIESFNKKGGFKKINGKVAFGENASGTFNTDNLGKIIITQDMSIVNGGFSIVVKNKWI